MDEKIIQSTKEYRKLPVRALRCMYTADLVAGLIVLAVIGAVNYFWLFPKDITVGKWISLALALLLCVVQLAQFCWSPAGLTGWLLAAADGALLLAALPVARMGVRKWFT